MNEQRAKGKGQRATYPIKIAIFLITLSGLILEVGLTRIYSASIWYHFAFVAISVALLGWGLGGFTVHLLKQRVRLSMDAAALVTLLYAGAIPLCLWLLARFPFEMERLPLYFLAPLLPFFLAGMALSIVFDIQRAVAGSLYFADLVGAAIGAVLVTLLLHALGGEAALLAAAIGPAIAAVLLTGIRGKGVGGRVERSEVSVQRSKVGESGLSPASRAGENKNQPDSLTVAKPSPLTLSQRERESTASRAEGNRNGGEGELSARPSPLTLSQRERESSQDKTNASDPGVARSALAPGYSLSRLQRDEDAPSLTVGIPRGAGDDQGDAAADGRESSVSDCAHGMECLFAHRCGGRRGAETRGTALHRFGCLDEYRRVGRAAREREGSARFVPRASVSADAECGDTSDRSGRWRRCGGSAGIGQPKGDSS